MNWHALSSTQIFKQLQTSEKGLTNVDAQRRIKKYGKNDLKGVEKKWVGWNFIKQFNSMLIYILIFACVVSFLIGHFIDAVVIGVIVILNSVIGFVQEYKAEEIIEKLKKSLRYKVLVLRRGRQQEIDSYLLVPGDVVLLEEGDNVLADCRIIEKENLQVNEAVLTGESFPVEKITDVLRGTTVLAERKNMLYAGTNVVKGKCLAVVVGTGKGTEFGKLAELVGVTKDEKMPLEKKVDSFSKKISLVILVLVGLTFLIGVYLGNEKMEMFLIAISLAVGAIPEGLPAIIAITLAVAIKGMYKVNTLVRRLPAAETLGRATVICTDKTGTLTEEELTADEIYSGKLFSVGGLKKLNKNIMQVLKVGILCNNARDEDDKILGDPTEIALIKIAKKFGMDKKKETETNVKLKEFAFSSERKMMSIIRKNGEMKTSYVKGASSIILKRCSKEFVDGKIKLLTEKRKQELEKGYMKMEEGGLRVLGFGFRQVTGISQEQAENHLIFSGFIGMIDPPRKEVKNAIKDAIDAGIEVKILTGDSARTTKTIAEKIGLKGEIIEGEELDRLPEEKWDAVVRDKTIFARITPKQKLKIVEILKKQKQVVAVTGDGANDILALKRADIGVSMGVRGSDVARDSSDIVLLDDNFASIINAVRQGRIIFDNLKKSIKFLLAANVASIFIILFALLIGMPLPFLPLALLWMNLVTDSLPALALAVEPAEKDVMKRQVRKDGLLSGIWHWILIAGILNFVSVIWLFGWALNNYGLEIARTMAITSAIFFELWFVFACKSNKSLFKTGIFNNKWLIWAVAVSAGLHLVAIYTLFGGIFGFVSLSVAQFGLAVLVSLSGLIFFEVWKLVANLGRKD